jgi:hypothetical protein
MKPLAEHDAYPSFMRAIPEEDNLLSAAKAAARWFYGRSRGFGNGPHSDLMVGDQLAAVLMRLEREAQTLTEDDLAVAMKRGRR